MEKIASVSELKSSLSGYLAQVKLGEEILVTERGRPIARVVPYLQLQGAEGNLAQQIRDGLIRAGNGRSIREFLETTERVRSEHSVVAALLEEREDR